MDNDYIPQLEREMRELMYLPAYTDHPMNTDPYYGLNPLTEELWAGLEITPRDYTMPFSGNDLVKREWSVAISRLESLVSTMARIDMNHTFIAGGAVFSCLFDCHKSDIDLFLHGLTHEEAVEYTRQFCAGLSLTRTPNSLTMETAGEILQIVLRLYKTPSEVIHGFDVDCCCMGFDGERVWLTERCLRSLRRGYNVVSFDRLSPSYEHRLVKYGTRGMAVKIPEFDLSKVDMNAIHSVFTHRVPGGGNNMSSSYRYIREMKGIDIILYMDYRCQRFSCNNARKAVDSLTHETSDYAGAPHYKRTDQGVDVERAMSYLVDTADEYPEYSEKYMKYANYTDGDESLWINCFLLNKSIMFIASYNNEEGVLFIPENVYKCLGVVRPWDIPQNITFKTTNPGEQMTNTFHRVVLEDNDVWYTGQFYKK